MKTTLQQIIEFQCPKWDDLPETSLFNSQVVEYINQILEPIMHGEKAITSTMIQNYSKWGIIPKIPGRKYGKQQIAFLIIIAIYKQVLPIDQVKKGIELQLKSMTIEEGYDFFVMSIEQAIQQIIVSIKKKTLYPIEGFTIQEKTEGIQAVSNAFVMKLLATMIIEAGGYDQIGEKDE